LADERLALGSPFGPGLEDVVELLSERRHFRLAVGILCAVDFLDVFMEFL
jgi:hypothetical protein